jgi:hypothetical protein
MAEYSHKDGQRMKWNVFIPLSESVLDTYPDLAAIFDGMRDTFLFIEGMTVDQMVRYIVLVYHIKSPLIQREEDLMSRKKRAALLIGCTTDDKGYFTEKVNEIIANRNTFSVDLILRFLRFEDNFDWVELCALTEFYYDYQKVISAETAVGGKKDAADIMDKKMAARIKSKGLKDEMKALSATLFRGDVDLMNFVGSTIVKEDIKKNLTPESRALAKAKKQAE